MAKVTPFRFFEKKVMLLIKQKRGQEKLVYYLKLYTHLIMALDELSSRRGFDRLRIVARLTKEESFPGEAHYIKYVSQLVTNILANQKKLQQLLAKDPAADPMHAKTHLLTAQNICMLRILKLSS
jgi:hypothetical protein